MQTSRSLQEIVSRLEYPGFSFVLGFTKRSKSIPYLQLERTYGTCNLTGGPLTWKSRKWNLSYKMVTSEVVQTAFLAILTAIEHEARERFTYRGQSIFCPHYNVEHLVALRRLPNALDERPSAPVHLLRKPRRAAKVAAGNGAASVATNGSGAGSGEASHA